MSRRVRHQLSVAVFIALVRECDNTVCLIRRSGTGWMDGMLSLPAGSLETNETIRAAALREVKEEVGVDLDFRALVHAHILHSHTGGADWMGHFFVAKEWGGEPRICEPDKHSELRWEPLDQLPMDVIGYVRQALNAISLAQPYSEFGWQERGVGPLRADAVR